MSTVAAMLTKLRVRLDEATADQWEDADLNYYIGRAEQWLADLLGALRGSGRFRARETLTLAADAETIAISTTANIFAEVVEFQMQWQGEYLDLYPLRDGEDGELRGVVNEAPGGMVIPRYTIRGDNFVFLPTSSDARTLWLHYRWLPSEKTSGNLETPAIYDETLLVRAAHFAGADAGTVNTAFEEEYAGLIAEIERREAGRVYGAATEVIRPRASRMLWN